MGYRKVTLFSTSACITCQNPMQRQSDIGQVCIEKEISIRSVQLQPGPNQGPPRAGQGPRPQVGGIVQIRWRREGRVRAQAVGPSWEDQEAPPTPGPLLPQPGPFAPGPSTPHTRPRAARPWPVTRPTPSCLASPPLPSPPLQLSLTPLLCPGESPPWGLACRHIVLLLCFPVAQSVTGTGHRQSAGPGARLGGPIAMTHSYGSPREAGWVVISPFLLTWKGAEGGGKHLSKRTQEQVKAGAVRPWTPALRIRTGVSSVQGHSPSSGQGPPVLSAVPPAPPPPRRMPTPCL